MTILVTGATGMVGRHVVAELVKSGHRVRALTRTPSAASRPDGVEVVGGDLTDPPSLEPSLNGVERMYLFSVGRTARAVVAAAKRAGVRRIVVLSGALADTDDSEEGYLAVERAVEDSGLEWTHVRPGEFAANWLDWAPAIKKGRVVRRPYGAAVTQPTCVWGRGWGTGVGFEPVHADAARTASTAQLQHRTDQVIRGTAPPR